MRPLTRQYVETSVHQPVTFWYGTNQMEKNASFTEDSVAQIFEKCVGCKWTLHILAQIRSGIVRPGQLERTAEGLTTKVLNQRLAKLSRFGIVQRQSFADSATARRVPPDGVRR